MYKVTLQPDRRKTLKDPGVCDFDIALSNEHLIGVWIVLDTLFVEEDKAHITIGEFKGAQSMLGNIPEHLLLVSDDTKDWIPDDAWYVFLDILMVGAPTMKYSGIIRGHKLFLIQSQTLDILQGVVTACSWFDQDPHKYILRYYEGDVPLTFALETRSSLCRGVAERSSYQTSSKVRGSQLRAPSTKSVTKPA